MTEPILYRHFASKRDLYLACVENAWQELRREWEAVVDAATDPRERVPAMARAAVLRHRGKAFLANLWIQALTEANDDAEIRAYLRRHVREVHDFVAAGIRRCQDEGAIPADRDASAEAWVFLAGGLLATFAQRLGGVLTPDDFAAIQRERRRWLIPV
jgi:AcrR family transcriptional regulator